MFNPTGLVVFDDLDMYREADAILSSKKQFWNDLETLRQTISIEQLTLNSVNMMQQMKELFPYISLSPMRDLK